MDDSDTPRTSSLVVTGGSSGIGAALCRAAARRGWHVWIGYASGADRAGRIAAEIGAAGGAATAIALPLDDPTRLRDGIETIAGHGTEPRALALCGAPAPEVAPFARLAPERIRHQLDCAVTGNHALIAGLWRRCFRPRGGGHVLAVLSAAQGPATAPHMAGYVAAKGGLEALLRAAAAELGRAGLRISVVRPGYVETPMLLAFQPMLLDRARETMPGGRFLDAEEVAGVLARGLDSRPPFGEVAELTLRRNEVAACP